MRRAVALLFFLGACGDDPEKDPAPPAPPPIVPAPEGPPVEWTHANADWFDLEMHVPKDWMGSQIVRLNGREVHFGGPGDPGKRPELIFGWDPSKESLDAWGAAKIRSFETSPLYSMRQKGSTTVAGMDALYCIVDTKVSREIGFYFVGRGHRGFVRGVAPIEEFARYGPIFEEAARLLRYNPQ